MHNYNYINSIHTPGHVLDIDYLELSGGHDNGPNDHDHDNGPNDLDHDNGPNDLDHDNDLANPIPLGDTNIILNLNKNSFYKAYVDGFIAMFAPSFDVLTRSEQGSIILLHVVETLEKTIDEKSELGDACLNHVIVKLINQVSPMTQSWGIADDSFRNIEGLAVENQKKIEFILKLYLHFMEIQRLYAIISGRKNIKYGFRMKTYLQLLDELDSVFDDLPGKLYRNSIDEDNFEKEKRFGWATYYKGYIAQWIVNNLTVRELTRGEIVGKLLEVMSTEITLIQRFLSKSEEVKVEIKVPTEQELIHLIGYLVEESKILVSSVVKEASGNIQTKIRLNPTYIHSIIKQDNDILMDKLLPMLVKPASWHKTDLGDIKNCTGGYLTNRCYSTETIVKSKWNCTLTGSISHDDINALNILQSFGYIIDLELLKEFRSNAKLSAIWTDENNLLWKTISTFFSEYKGLIYYPWSCDFRYRKYAQGGILSPTNNKLVRELIGVSEFYEVDDDVKEYIKYQLVRKIINKKATDEECNVYNWSDLMQDINNPSPEILKIRKKLLLGMKGEKINDLIWLDHNCSGFMILSLLFKDYECAKYVNLIDPHKIYDFYTTITDLVVKQAKECCRGDDLYHPFRNYIEIKTKEHNLKKCEGILKTYLSKAVGDVLDQINSITPIKDIRVLISLIQYPIIKLNYLGEDRYYTIFLNINLSKQTLTKYFKKGEVKHLYNLNNSKLLRIYTYKEINNFVGNLENKRSILKKIIMCVPYLMSQFTGVKSIKKELFKDSFDENVLLNTLAEYNSCYSNITLEEFDEKFGCKWMINASSHFIYQYTIKAVSEVVPNTMKGMIKLSNTIRLRRSKCMEWVNPSGSKICYQYHPVYKSIRRYGPGAKRVITMRQINKNEVDYCKNYTSSIAHFIHSIDASLVTMVINRWNQEYPKIPIITIHDAYGVPYSHAKHLRPLVLSCLQELLDSELLKSYISTSQTNFTVSDKKAILKTLGSLKSSDISKAKYFLR